ncbi:MAG: hypothetical protein ABIR91_03540 [Candidatus Saccharimonadales bacterium]
MNVWAALPATHVFIVHAATGRLWSSRIYFVISNNAGADTMRSRKSNNEGQPTNSYLDEDRARFARFDGESAPKSLRRKIGRGVLVGVAGATLLGVGAAASVVNDAHKLIPKTEVSIEGGHGDVVDIIKSEATCPLVYRTLVSGVKSQFANKINTDNIPIVSLLGLGDIKLSARGMEIEHAAVDTEVCQKTTDIEKIYNKKENSVTYNIPAEAIYTVNHVNVNVRDETDANANGDTSDLLYAIKPSGERLELVGQQIKTFMDNTGLGDETAFAKDKNVVDSTLLAIATAQAENIAGQQCAPKVIEAASTEYIEGFKNITKIGLLPNESGEMPTVHVNFVKGGKPAAPTATTMMDALGNKISSLTEKSELLSLVDTEKSTATCDISPKVIERLADDDTTLSVATPGPLELQLEGAN